MDPQARRRLITVFAIISGVLIVGAFCAQQYLTYRSESRTLTAAIRWVDHQLRRVQAVERQPAKLSQVFKGVEEKLSQQRLQVPAKLDVGGFLDHFSAMASRFDVEVKASQGESSSRDFYDQATLRLKLAGDDKDVRTLLEKLSTGDRLTRYKVLQWTNKECDIELSIFSIPEAEEEPLGVFDIQACAEFNSRVWLWPFKGRIQDRYEELNSLCKERQRQSSAIRSTEELMGKLRLSRFIEEVVKHLAKAETPSQTE
ncbi:MAG: hypothetical protein JRJ47_12880 [Deltaproteobacteria bacterium]|nr:hypothetical protein [Deltaproteobacteria bacterium]